MRLLSYSEISAALSCEAKHDMRYGSQLAGSSLTPKRLAPQLSNGRAWGAAVAAFHETATTTAGDTPPDVAAEVALLRSLHSDADDDFDAEQYAERAVILQNVLAHYLGEQAMLDPLPLRNPEHELLVPIPSRAGKRRSSRFQLRAFVDGVLEYDDRLPWLAEFKLRKRLTRAEIVEKSRQTLWYAWAWRETFERDLGGVLVEERLFEAPQPPRILQSGKLSDTQTNTTAYWYARECRRLGVDVNERTYGELQRRRWVNRVPIVFSRNELEEAGRELVSAARLIADLDSGRRYPIRHPTPFYCTGCNYREICNDPSSSAVDELFERHPPKRDREEDE